MHATHTAAEFALVEPGTVVESSADGTAVEVALGGPRLFVLELVITQVIEQESLEISIWGSSDGQDWGKLPLLKFPQQFYRGAARMALDLSDRPEVRFIRPRWEVNRWGRGVPSPRFTFGLLARPADAGKR
jgi:hypothetical protein